jgi:hypothetical protein
MAYSGAHAGCRSHAQDLRRVSPPTIKSSQQKVFVIMSRTGQRTGHGPSTACDPRHPQAHDPLKSAALPQDRGDFRHGNLRPPRGPQAVVIMPWPAPDAERAQHPPKAKQGQAGPSKAKQGQAGPSKAQQGQRGGKRRLSGEILITGIGIGIVRSQGVGGEGQPDLEVSTLPRRRVHRDRTAVCGDEPCHDR